MKPPSAIARVPNFPNVRKPPSPKVDLQAKVAELLSKYEEAEKELANFMGMHQGIFDKVEELEKTKEEAKESIKRILFTKDGPPVNVPKGHKSFVWAEANLFRVHVTYKQRSSFYDPAKLPKSVLMLPGVVLEVDTNKCAALSDPAVEKALVKGEWMTPSVSIERMK